MSDSAERLKRLLFLVPYVSKHPGISVTDLAKAMGSSRDELLEDLELLPLVGRPPFTPADYIDLTIEDDKVSLTLDQRFSRPPRLTASEVVALGAAAATLEPQKGDPLAHALEKLEGALPPASRATFKTLSSRITTGGDDALKDLLPPLAEAVTRRREVVIEYLSAGGAEPTRRTIQPWRVFLYRGHWYLLGLDVGKQEQRLFRVDRIPRLTATATKFEQPKHLPKPGEEFQSKESPPEAVPVLRFSKRIAALGLEQFGPEAKQEKDGRVTVTLPNATSEWLVSLVLKHAGDVEVIQPEALRAVVSQAVARALAQYA
jgi:proteasome accessory factor C